MLGPPSSGMHPGIAEEGTAFFREAERRDYRGLVHLCGSKPFSGAFLVVV